MYSLLIALICIFGLIWFWHNSMRARETAILKAKHLCDDAHVQLLDETVAMRKITLTRQLSGSVNLKREYRFDYTTDGEYRHAGRIIIIGHTVTKAELTQKQTHIPADSPIKQGRATVIQLKDFKRKR